MEAEFNARYRELLRAYGLQVLHIREADEVGVGDLMIYCPPQGPLDFHANFLGWVELKIGNRALDASQKQFLRDEARKGIRVYVARYWPETDKINMSRGKYNSSAGEVTWMDLGDSKLGAKFDWFRAFMTGKFTFPI